MPDIVKKVRSWCIYNIYIYIYIYIVDKFKADTVDTFMTDTVYIVAIDTSFGKRILIMKVKTSL